MIHEIHRIMERLIDYAVDLSFEWGWKRESSRMHQSEYEQLKFIINTAKILLERLENIDHTNQSDLQKKL